jgi:hypothetical protein
MEVTLRCIASKCDHYQATKPTSFERVLDRVFRHLCQLLPLSSLAVLVILNRKIRGIVHSIIDPTILLGRPGHEFERAAFLVHAFDKNYPRHLICYTCGLYHPRRIPGQRNRKRKDHATFVRKHTPLETDPHFETHHRLFSWIYIHIAMRNARYSPQHGSPVLDLSYWKHYDTWECDTLAVDVQGRLLLRDRWYLRIPNLEHRMPEIRFIPYRNSFCPHYHDTSMPLHFSDEVKAAAKYLCKSIDARQGFTYKRHRCTSCPTEVVIEVEPRDQFQARFKKGHGKDRTGFDYVLSFSRFIDFGKCRVPDEMEWKSLTTWVEERSSTNLVRPGWSGHEPSAGMTTRPTINITTTMEPISVRFRRQQGQRHIRIVPLAEIPIGPPPPYQRVNSTEVQRELRHCSGLEHEEELNSKGTIMTTKWAENI